MYKLILYATLAIGIIPLLICFLKAKKIKSHNNYFLPFIILTGIASIYEFIGTFSLNINSSYWFIIYDFLQFIVLFYFFNKVLEKKYKSILYSFIILFVATFLLSLYYWSHKNALISFSINSIMATFFVFVIIFIWLKNEFYKLEIPILYKNAKFIFISGFLIYYASTIFLFIAANFIFKNGDLKFNNYWFLNIIATFILRIFLIIGTWRELQK